MNCFMEIQDKVLHLTFFYLRLSYIVPHGGPSKNDADELDLFGGRVDHLLMLF